MHTQSPTLSQKDIRHKVQTPVSAEDTQTGACKRDANTHNMHIHRHNTHVKSDTWHGAEISLLRVDEGGGGCPDVLQMPNNRETH